MGMEVLHSTKSLTYNKHHLETIAVPLDDAFEVTAINNPRRRLRCHLDSYWCILPDERAFKANADTESQVGLVSLGESSTSFLGPQTSQWQNLQMELEQYSASSTSF